MASRHSRSGHNQQCFASLDIFDPWSHLEPEAFKISATQAFWTAKQNTDATHCHWNGISWVPIVQSVWAWSCEASDGGQSPAQRLQCETGSSQGGGEEDCCESYLYINPSLSSVDLLSHDFEIPNC